MKRLLLPLLAALALPTAVNAESYWMIIMLATSKGNSLEKIEMISMSQCEDEGKKAKKKLGSFKGSQNLVAKIRYACIKGK